MLDLIGRGMNVFVRVIGGIDENSGLRTLLHDRDMLLGGNHLENSLDAAQIIDSVPEGLRVHTLTVLLSCDG